jgi:hypothetical protein
MQCAKNAYYFEAAELAQAILLGSWAATSAKNASVQMVR